MSRSMPTHRPTKFRPVQATLKTATGKRMGFLEREMLSVRASRGGTAFLSKGEDQKTRGISFLEILEEVGTFPSCHQPRVAYMH